VELNGARIPNPSSWRVSTTVGRSRFAHCLPSLLHFIMDHYRAQLIQSPYFLGLPKGRSVPKPSHRQLRGDVGQLFVWPRPGKYTMNSDDPLSTPTHTSTPKDVETQESNTVILYGPNKPVDGSHKAATIHVRGRGRPCR
jgi:hypothetical protein